jgi:hypothetical protein
MTRFIVLFGGALAAVVWLVHTPAWQHDSRPKQAVALIAITVPFLVLDVIFSVRKSRRARRRSSSSPASARARVGAGRW